jgi:hypothetical protein
MDIVKAAEQAWQPTSFECKQAIADAILAERRRCAAIADDAHYKLVSRGSGRRGAVAYDIREAILSGEQQ